MLHLSKSDSILQWFNSMVTKGNIQSISQLSDGVQFFDIVSTINSLKKGKLLDANVSCFDSLINDSNTSVINATQPETESTNDGGSTDTYSTTTEMVVDEDDPVSQKETETETKVSEEDVSDQNKEKNDSEIEKRFDAVKEFIDVFFNLDSSLLITYLDCINAKELELAKVAVLLLSAMVQSFLSSNNDLLHTTTLLELQVQEDIKECLSLVLETSLEDGPLKKSDLQRILSRPSKSKATPRRRRSSRGGSEVADTPEPSKSLPKKRRDRASVIAEEFIESPLKSLLESPQIRFKAAMFRKDAELNKLREDLETEETKVIDLTLDKRSLNAELEKKKRELEFFKEEHRKLQASVDEGDELKKVKIEEILAERERDTKIIQNMKAEMENFKKENDNLCNDIASLEEKLSQSNAEKTNFSRLNDELMVKLKDLELNINIKEDKIKDFRQQLASKAEDLKQYKQMYEDMSNSRESVPKTSPKTYENARNIIYADERSARHMLSEKENECAELRRQLVVEIEKSKLLEEQSKVAEQNIRSLMNNLTSTQSDLESSQKQISIYESWSKSIGTSGSIPNLNDEIVPGNLPGSLPTGLWPSTSSEGGSERERNVKEEPDSTKAFDTFSGKCMGTRSRSASALGYHREPCAAPTVPCSKAEFLRLKKVAHDIAKLLKKKCESTEVPHLTQLEEQAMCFSSVTDACNFYLSVLDSLKSLKMTPFSKRHSKRKCHSQGVDETDTELINHLQCENTSLRIELESTKQELRSQQEDFQKLMDAKVREVVDAEKKNKELEIDRKDLNDKLEKSQQETTDANKKYEYAKQLIEKARLENKKLLRACMILKDDTTTTKVEPCKDCQLLREKLLDVKQERKEYERDSVELKALLRDLESKNNNLERQLKNEMKEKRKLEFQIQRESAFLSGSMSQRNAVIHQYFQQGLAESKKANIRAENARKTVVENIEGPNQVLSFNTYIVNSHETKDPCPENSISNITTYANRSIRSGFLQTDDEEDFLNHSSLAQIQRDVFTEPDPDNRRLTEIQRRNTLCLPHLQSSYPLELQNMTPTEQKYFGNLRAPVQPYKRPVAFTVGESHSTFAVDSEDSQDVQPLPVRKRKGPEMHKSSVQPMKKAARSSSQVRLVQKVKPVTPVRKTGFISKTKSFKTPTSIRRLMRITHKK